MAQSICWECENAKGNGCSWFRKHEPVPEWDAIEKTLIIINNKRQEKKVGSYIVKNCPVFQADRNYKGSAKPKRRKK